jgi:hypothetical protein
MLMGMQFTAIVVQEIVILYVQLQFCLPGI